MRRGQLLHDDDFSIVAQYGIEWRGYAQYYVLALDTRRLTTLQWVMEASMLRTLAAKHQTTLPKMARKYKAVVTVDGVRRKCYEVRVEWDGKSPLIARMGGFPLTRQTKAVLVDRRPPIVNSRSELLQRLAAEECEHCGSHVRLEAHHIRRLADLNKPGQANRPWWISLMASRRRKTLVLCQACHGGVHAEVQPPSEQNSGERQDRKGAAGEAAVRRRRRAIEPARDETNRVRIRQSPHRTHGRAAPGAGSAAGAAACSAARRLSAR